MAITLRLVTFKIAVLHRLKPALAHLRQRRRRLDLVAEPLVKGFQHEHGGLRPDQSIAAAKAEHGVLVAGGIAGEFLHLQLRPGGGRDAAPGSSLRRRPLPCLFKRHLEWADIQRKHIAIGGGGRRTHECLLDSLRDCCRRHAVCGHDPPAGHAAQEGHVGGARRHHGHKPLHALAGEIGGRFETIGEENLAAFWIGSCEQTGE